MISDRSTSRNFSSTKTNSKINIDFSNRTNDFKSGGGIETIYVKSCSQRRKNTFSETHLQKADEMFKCDIKNLATVKKPILRNTNVDAIYTSKPSTKSVKFADQINPDEEDPKKIAEVYLVKSYFNFEVHYGKKQQIKKTISTFPDNICETNTKCACLVF